MRDYRLAVSQICCKYEVKFLHVMEKIDLLISNFRPNNFLRFITLCKNLYIGYVLDF